MKLIRLGVGVLLVLVTLPSAAAGQSQDDVYPPEVLQTLTDRAQNGEAKAQMKLAAMYLQGSGVAKDVSQALAWYEQAADQNVAFAQHRLASLYLAGEVVARDSGRALALLQRAAGLGFIEAQLDLSRLYEAGEDVPQDYVSAHKWLNIAASLADFEIEPRQSELESKMSFSERVTAQYLSRRCIFNGYQDC